MKSLSLVCGAALVSGFVTPPASGGVVTQIVAFGDSLLDTGNAFAATGYPPPPYYNGRFSNGPVWLEYFASGLNIASPTPSLAGGTNYAYGGAESGTGTSPQLPVPNVLTQVNQFVSGHSLSVSQLVVMDGGANDFFDGQTDPTVPVNNLATAITSLAAVGGKQFLVQNLPGLGDVPGSLSLPQSQRDALNSLTLAYDSLLQARLAQLSSSLDVTINVLDLNSLTNQVRANPGAYGFTNTTTSALGDGVLSGNGYLFWDNVHPTTAADVIIGRMALSVVPEPSPWLLGLAGLVGFIAVGACRRWPRALRFA